MRVLCLLSWVRVRCVRDINGSCAYLCADNRYRGKGGGDDSRGSRKVITKKAIFVREHGLYYQKQSIQRESNLPPKRPSHANMIPLVLPTLHNLNLHPRPIPLIRRQILNLLQNSMSLRPHNPSKNNMLIIQKLCPRTRNKKLTPIRIPPRIRHTQ